MSKIENLHIAKSTKNDEFYTQYSDIEKELSNYINYFNGKIVLCNCNDSRESNFFKYFMNNFIKLSLKKLLCITYNKDDKATLLSFDGTTNDAIESKLNSNGDFRNPECIQILKQSDIIVTNPPFSLFRDYIAQLVEYNKKFLIIGNGNAVINKEIFPLIKNNQIWIGNKSFSHGMDFYPGQNYDPKKCKYPKQDENGNPLVNVMMCLWFTNLEHNKRNTPIQLKKTYSPQLYPQYDNYNAINVNKVTDIPSDYYDLMGVPITFLDKYCPEQFEILGITNNTPDNAYGLKQSTTGYTTWASINGKNIYTRLLIKRKI